MIIKFPTLRVTTSYTATLLSLALFSDVMSYSGYTPLDVATATIKGNQELVLALEESHLEHVVQLLVVMTTNPRGSSEGSSMDGRSDLAGGLGLIHRVSFSFNYEWSPQAGQKCLEFLHAAVWVDSKSFSSAKCSFDDD